MQSFLVPVAPVWLKIACGLPLIIVTGTGIGWGAKGMGLSLRVLRGIAPAPQGSTRVLSGVLGFGFYGLVIAAAGGCGVLLTYLLTAQPTLVDDRGIAVGTWLLEPQQEFIAWHDVSAVDCGIPPRRDVIRRLVVRSKSATVELGSAGIPLEPVRAFIERHVPRGTVRPCRRETLDHVWSY